MARITDSNLNAVVTRINRLFNVPNDPYTASGEPNVGNFHLDHAYGGVCLRRMTKGGGASNVFNCGYVSKKELYSLMFAFIEGVYQYQWTPETV